MLIALQGHGRWRKLQPFARFEHFGSLTAGLLFTSPHLNSSHTRRRPDSTITQHGAALVPASVRSKSLSLLPPRVANELNGISLSFLEQGGDVDSNESPRRSECLTPLAVYLATPLIPAFHDIASPRISSTAEAAALSHNVWLVRLQMHVKMRPER